MHAPRPAGQLSDLEQVRAALANAETEAQRRGPYVAEIVPQRSPLWHLVRAAANREASAADYLVKRGFGTYLPTFGRDDVLPKTGRVRAGAPLFPGYLFVFVWSIDHHWRRITACPGVMSIVLEAERPVVVPDRVIDEIQVLELLNGNIDDPCRKAARGWRKRVHRRMLRERERITVTISTPSRFMELDESGRISALLRALGLVSGASAQG
jgi:transcription antitermination factor NusG